MLSINRNIVNDRISNRIDSVLGISGNVAEWLRLCLHDLRCLMHQQCFDVLAFERGLDPRGWGKGLKRIAFDLAAPVTEPSTATPETMPTTRRYWLATSSRATASSASSPDGVSHRVVRYAG